MGQNATHVYVTQTGKKALCQEQRSSPRRGPFVAGGPSRHAARHSLYFDIFRYLSKFAHVEAIKYKTGAEVKALLEKIFLSGRKPLQLQTYSGTEFKNKVVQAYLKRENEHFYVPDSEQHG